MTGNMTDLSGKVALVTGGSRGIGRACARALAARGADIAICGRTEADLETAAAELRQTGATVHTYRTDVSRLDEIEALIAGVLDDADRVDILVNNAVTSTSAPFDRLTDDEFRYHIDVKLMAYIRIARLVLPQMGRRGWGRIVNIGGMTARIVAPLRMTNGVTNAGVANFTKQFAGYAAQFGVTVNCVHPGYTATERVRQIFAREAEEAGLSVAEIERRNTEAIPMGRLIEPADLANVVAFLCAPESQMITGQSIAVDGGSGQSIPY